MTEADKKLEEIIQAQERLSENIQKLVSKLKLAETEYGGNNRRARRAAPRRRAHRSP